MACGATPVAFIRGVTSETEEAARFHKVAMLRNRTISLWEEALQAWIT
jgi:hypothetical protein